PRGDLAELLRADRRPRLRPRHAVAGVDRLAAPVRREVERPGVERGEVARGLERQARLELALPDPHHGFDRALGARLGGDDELDAEPFAELRGELRLVGAG